MAVTPLTARCRRCHGDFVLYQLVEARSGKCPLCGWRLTADWSSRMLEQADRADIAHRHLIGALRELHEIPGNLLVRPRSVLRNLFEEVGWQRELTTEPNVLSEELDDLRRLVADWEALDSSTAQPRARPGLIRRLLARFAGDAARPGRDVPHAPATLAPVTLLASANHRAALERTRSGRRADAAGRRRTSRALPT
jgi:hypothetical protein